MLLAFAAAVAGVLIGAGAGAASADGAIQYAPVNTPGPPLSPPVAQMAEALQCSTGVDHATRAAVLLVPGTGATANDNFSWNYEPAFNKLGIPWCAVTFPADGNDDIQISGEYLVYAIRTMYARSGQRIAIVGHSQGGMDPRWALRWWPDTRAMVDDVIGFAGTNHGTNRFHADCPRGCLQAHSQQASDSQFIAALNSGQETFPGISYTEIYTHMDETVEPNQNDNGTSSLHGGGGMITNIAVQDICPADAVEHLGLGTYDPVAYALAIDALNNPGPADPARLPHSVCTKGLMPGVDPLTFFNNGLSAFYNVETSKGTYVQHEPPLACYVTASCTATSPAHPAPRPSHKTHRRPPRTHQRPHKDHRRT
ncbi:MAG: esterase/lipase family protein [Solirubrobacteraceae bacterium]